MAKAAPPDKRFKRLLEFPSEPRYPTVTGLHDTSVKNLSEEKLLQLCDIIIDTAKGLDSRVIIDGSCAFSDVSVAVVNSHGISQSIPYSSSRMFCTTSIRLSDENIGTGFELWLSRDARGLEKQAERISNVAVEEAQKALNPQKPSSGVFPVVFHGRHSHSWLTTVIQSGVSAKSLMDGVSYFSDRLGTAVMSEGVQVVDDPLVAGGFGSGPFDDEGAPTSRQEIIGLDGVLRKFVTDSYTANAQDLPITGHASRGNPATRSTPALHQLQIGAGNDGKLDDLIKEVKKGFYVESSLTDMGLKGPNISEKLSRAFYVENGEIRYPVRDAMIAGNVHSFLKGIRAVGSELVVEFGRQAPPIRVEEMTVSGPK